MSALLVKTNQCIGAHIDDGRGDGLGRIDDFFDPRYALRDIHAGNTSKVKCLECHLRAWFANALCSHGPNG